MTYSTATVIEYRNRNLCFQPTVLKRQPPLYAAAPQNARHNASWCNFVDCIIFSTRRLELRERRQNALLQHDWSIVNWVKRPWIVGTIYEFRDFRPRSLFLHIRSNTQTWIYESRIQDSSYEVCCLRVKIDKKKNRKNVSTTVMEAPLWNISHEF